MLFSTNVVFIKTFFFNLGFLQTYLSLTLVFVLNMFLGQMRNKGSFKKLAQICIYLIHLILIHGTLIFPQGSDDDTAANFVKFTCRNITNGESYVMMQQPGAGYWGTYGPWSESCPLRSAGCGIQQKVEPYQSILGDDTELNNLKFYCCEHI